MSRLLLYTIRSMMKALPFGNQLVEKGGLKSWKFIGQSCFGRHLVPEYYSDKESGQGPASDLSKFLHLTKRNQLPK